MTHARIVKAQMVDWIRNCVEQDLPSPTDDEIVERFNLNGLASARSLLADCSEEGAITVSWNAPGRPIALGPKERAQLVPAMPSAVLARKANRDVDATVKRIRDIVHRKPTDIADEVAAEARASSSRRVAAARSGTTIRPGDKGQPSKRRLTLDQTAAKVKEILARSSATPKPDSPPAQCPRAEAAKGRSLVETPPTHIEAAPQPVPVELHALKLADVVPRLAKQVLLIGETQAKLSPPPEIAIQRLPTAPGRDIDPPVGHRPEDMRRAQVNAAVTEKVYETVKALASAQDMPVSRYASILITEALTARETVPAPTDKPRVRAAVVKAWQEDGRPFGEFITALIDLGLIEYQSIIAYADAEAAE